MVIMMNQKVHRAVSYTHLDVYKRQAVKLESANQDNFYIVVCNSDNSACDFNH